MNRELIQDVLDGAKSLRIVVWGDAMLDVYQHVRNVRMCPEAPATSVEIELTRFALGGAANVAAGVAALGAEVQLVSVVGDDEHLALMRELCASHNVGIDHVEVSKSRKTTTKTRFVRGVEIMFRIDDDHKEPWNATKALLRASQSWTSSALIVSDYAKGAVTTDAVSAVHQDVFGSVYVSPKPASKVKWNSAEACICNRKELMEIALDYCGADPSKALPPSALLASTEFKCVIATMEADGVVVGADGHDLVFIKQPANATGNTCGAGDTFLAAFVVAHKAIGDVFKAAEFANYCAGIAVQCAGTTVVEAYML